MADAPRAIDMEISVCWTPNARVVSQWHGRLAMGSTVADALRASGQWVEGDTALAESVGVWGEATSMGSVLRDGDRVELYRALLVDPKVARRERFKQQGSRSSGLFAKKRAGAKAGY
jgi:uncharacterized protein